MHRTCYATALLLVLFQPSVFSATPPAPNGPSAEATVSSTTARVEQISYLFGFQNGNKLRRQGLFLDMKVYREGLEDGFAGKTPRMPLGQAHSAFVTLQNEGRTRMAERNKEQGEKYRRENGRRPEVTTTESGLQYEVLREGTGATPAPTDMVKVDYHGTLVSGTVFESTYNRGKPAVLPVTGIIKGWAEALLLMKVGAKCRFVLPPEIAYGERPPRRSYIGKNATLIFDLELLSIEGPAPPRATFHGGKRGRKTRPRPHASPKKK